MKAISAVIAVLSFSSLALASTKAPSHINLTQKVGAAGDINRVPSQLTVRAGGTVSLKVPINGKLVIDTVASSGLATVSQKYFGNPIDNPGKAGQQFVIKAPTTPGKSTITFTATPNEAQPNADVKTMTLDVVAK
jgi:hypothetical protein